MIAMTRPSRRLHVNAIRFLLLLNAWMYAQRRASSSESDIVTVSSLAVAVRVARWRKAPRAIDDDDDDSDDDHHRDLVSAYIPLG